MRDEPRDPLRIAFYTRISTDEDHQKYSLGAQKDQLEAFCKAQWDDAWRLHSVYRDTESGTHMHRPGLEEMLDDAAAQAFDTLLVFRVDRLSRKVRELAQMVDELTKNGVTLKSITEPFDTSNPAGKMMLQMLGVFAEFEHATIVERTKVGMEKKARGGDWVGGVVPYGYQLDPEKGLVLAQDEAVIVKKMFKMYAVGKEGTHTIGHTLNGAGYRNRRGKKWDKRVILNMIKNPLYVGKLRWKDVLYEGTHDPIISDVLFEKTQAILQQRAQDLNGRRFHNRDARLLAGTITCARCQSHMVGVSTHKKARRFPYYICSKRWNIKDCDQDYVRADLLEAGIMKDVKTVFRDEAFMARIWDEANRRLSAEKPDVDQELGKVETQAAQTQARIDRYFEAFEAGTLKPALCNEKVQRLTARLEELEAERQALEGPQKSRSTNRGSGLTEPEIWFKIVHITPEHRDLTQEATNRDQTVEIALGPKGTFEHGHIGTLTRRVPADRVVSAVPPCRGTLKRPPEPKTPRVAELLRQAIAWRALLESGEVATGRGELSSRIPRATCCRWPRSEGAGADKLSANRLRYLSTTQVDS